MKTLKQRIEGRLYRDSEIRADAIIDDENRTFRVVASTEFAVLRQSFFSAPWLETLGHKRAEVDLSRLQKGAPVLYNHNRTRQDRIGVVEDAKLNSKEKRVEATIRLSKRADVDDIWTDVRDGILKNISVGYSVNERTLTREGKGEPDEFRITSWTPAEISLVDVGADPNAQVGRELGDDLEYRIFDIQTEGVNEMSKENEPTVTSEETRADDTVVTPSAPVVDLDAERSAARDEGVAEGRRAEQERVKEINALFEQFPQFDAVRSAAITDGSDIEATRALLLDALGKDSQPAGGDAVRVDLQDDATDKFIRAGTMAISCRAGTASDEERVEVGKTGFRGFTLYEFARRALEMSGQNTDRFGKLELVGRAFTTSDFPLLLQDAANKSMLMGWDESPETWDAWCSTGELSDFKVGNRVNLSSFEALTQINEDGEYTFGSMVDEGQTIQLATYGKMFGISRQAVINDDLGAFTRIPAAMGRAAARVVGDLAYGVLTGNALLSDGIALFAGTAIGTQHGNLNVGGAGALSVATVDGARVAMGRQTDASNSATALNIRPAFLIVPMAIETSARTLMASEWNPAEGGTTSFREPNGVRGLAAVVSDARLDVDSTTRWYLAASPTQGDTVEVAFLDGNRAPMLEQQAGWSIDGTEYKVRIDVAAAAMDFRGLQRNDGV